MTNILIGVLSCKKNGTKRQAIRETWMKDVPPDSKVVFIIGGHTCTELIGDRLFVDAPDDYAHLPLKMKRFWELCLTQDYPTIFKCDDDTYLCYERLSKLGKGAYLGRAINKKRRPRFCSGGAGYRVRKHYLPALLSHYNDSPGPEDVRFAMAAKRIKVRPRNCKLFRWK
jgi:hypothetical protein